MRAKSDWFPLLTAFILRFERQYDVWVKVIRSDNEFDMNKIRSWCAKRGIRQQLTEPDESSSNGKVERRHRTLFDGMRAMMFDAAQILASYGRKHYKISHGYETDSRHAHTAGTSRLLKLSLDTIPTLVAY